MREYKQISYEERVKLAQQRQSKSTITEIAEALGRSKSTISRELKRNEAPPGEYWPDTAHQKTMLRRKRGSRIDGNVLLREFVKEKLCNHYWTPEQIAGWLKERQTELPKVSHETIYTWLYAKAQRLEKLWKFLPRHKAVRGLRKRKGAVQSRIPNRISIHDRPKVVQKGKDFGHWEGDLMAFQKNSQHILVLRERKTMFTRSIPLPSKKAADTSHHVIDLLKNLPPQARKTLTLDNGGEFAAHGDLVKRLGLQSYFCDPYASWQKGGIENTNGRLRRDLPRKTNIKSMPMEEFDETLENYNMTPRKKLKWLTPLEAFNFNLHRVALQT
jgi:IS30 family transposase